MTDNINHPAHYADGWSNGAEVIDITEHLNFNRGNAVKYIARAGRKSPETELEDLKKALWYITREIDRLWADEAEYNEYGDRIDLDRDREVPGGTAWDINTPTYPVRFKLVVPLLNDEHRDRLWQDNCGFRWRWYGDEDGHWEYRLPPNGGWIPLLTKDSIREFGPYTSLDMK